MNLLGDNTYIRRLQEQLSENRLHGITGSLNSKELGVILKYLHDLIS